MLGHSSRINEQGSRVDAAVVVTERDLAERGHLAPAHLVQNLAGAGIGAKIGGGCLVAGEALQHADGDVRVDPQHLHRRDDAVAPEGGRVPGDACVGVEAVLRRRVEHVEVGHAAA
jgi:hypothetical protein